MEVGLSHRKRLALQFSSPVSQLDRSAILHTNKLIQNSKLRIVVSVVYYSPSQAEFYLVAVK